MLTSVQTAQSSTHASIFDNVFYLLCPAATACEVGKACRCSPKILACTALQVLDLLEDACEGLVSRIESSKFATES